MNPPIALLPQDDQRVVAATASASTSIEILSSQALLKGRREMLIQHGDRTYRLRHTSNDKLILTK
jgi:hemin uptake protein HemP